MVYLIFLIVGFIFFIVSIYNLKQSLSLIRNSERTIGRVSELKEIYDDDNPTYLPIFHFETHDHKKFIYRHHTSSSRPEWAIGQKEEFIYDPLKPETARLLNYSGIFYWNIVLMAVSIVLIVIGIGYLLFYSFL